jgi:tetratricopeptide (TPR) repeat protein
MTAYTAVYLVSSSAMAALVLVDWRRLDRALSAANARPSATRLNAVVRVVLLVSLALGMLLPPFVHPVLLGVVAVVIGAVSRPGSLLSLTGGPEATPGGSSEVQEAVSAAIVGMQEAARIATGEPTRALELLDDVVEKLADALGSKDQTVRELVVDALERKGNLLQQLGRFEEALNVWNELHELGPDTGSASPYVIARALLGRAYAVGRLGSDDEELETLHRIEREFADDPTERVRRIVDTALYNEAAAFYRTERPIEAIDSYDRLIGRLEADPAQAWDELLSEALVNKGITAEVMGNLDMALQADATVVAKFGDSDNSEIRLQVAIALIGRGNALTFQGDLGGAIEAYDEIERRFATSGPPAEVALALVEKAAVLANMSREPDAVRVCAQVAKRYGESSDPKLRLYVEQAHAIERACLEGDPPDRAPGEFRS